VRPRVGIPLCLDDRGRWRAGRAYQYLDRSYADAVSAAGGWALYLPLQPEAEGLVAGLDALLIPGGDDFPPPDPYPPDVAFDPAPPDQIAFDRALLEAALARRLPVLGVCYGMQLLALAHGGSLVYDLPHDLPGAGAHRLPEDEDRHAIEIEADSQLARIANATSSDVNSLHHQAVAEPGDALTVAARAADGVVEAIEAPDHPFCIGVQWHPEKLAGPAGAGLFRALVDAARARL
jgi:putative glutamine amidotransferase